MKKLAILGLEALLAISLIKIFSVDDALVEFVVLGQVPGTTISLNLLTVSLLMMLAIFIIGKTAQAITHDLTEFKLETIEADKIKAAEEVAMTKKLQNAKEISQQLEIDDLEVLTAETAD